MKLFTMFFAFSTMVYELVLAEVMSALSGNALFYYNMTIGLYVTSMGLGALHSYRYSKNFLDQQKDLEGPLHNDLMAKLVSLELWVAVLGALSPFLLVTNDFLFFEENMIIARQSIQYFIVLLLGFLCGHELPLLMSIEEKIFKKNSMGILGFDYLGSMVGGVMFSFALVKHMKVYMISILVAFLSLIVLVVFMKSLKIKMKRVNYVLSFMAIILGVGLMDHYLWKTQLYERFLNKLFLGA